MRSLPSAASSSPTTTVHAPQSPSAQPSFVPQRPRCSRSHSSTVVVGGTPETSTRSPSSTNRIVSAGVDSLIRASTSPIGGVTPRRDEQGYVIMRVRIGDAELDYDLIEKGRLGQRNIARTEIRGDVKRERIAPRTQGAAFEQRRSRTTVVVRVQRRQQRRRGAGIDPVQLDLQTARRNAGGRIEHVCRQFSHTPFRGGRPPAMFIDWLFHCVQNI